MTAQLIGLGGRLRAGKDEVAAQLVRGHGFVRVGMSDPLNDALLAINPVIIIEEGTGGIYDWDDYATFLARVGYVEAKKNPYVRSYLQRLGTEVGRNMIDENVWVEIAARRIQEHLSAGRSVVITGIRYINEVRMIHNLGGMNVWVERPGSDPSQNHPSEQADPRWFDRTLVNDGTLEDLWAKADGLILSTKSSTRLSEHSAA